MCALLHAVKDHVDDNDSDENQGSLIHRLKENVFKRKKNSETTSSNSVICLLSAADPVCEGLRRPDIFSLNINVKNEHLPISPESRALSSPFINLETSENCGIISNQTHWSRRQLLKKTYEMTLSSEWPEIKKFAASLIAPDMHVESKIAILRKGEALSSELRDKLPLALSHLSLKDKQPRLIDKILETFANAPSDRWAQMIEYAPLLITENFMRSFRLLPPKFLIQGLRNLWPIVHL